RVGELRVELDANVFSHFVTAALDAGAYGGLHILRTRGEVAKHLSYTFFYDAFDGAAPSGVEDAYGVVFGIDKNDGEAVGGLNG
ncbi:MAG: hypothetical protein WAN03_14630, partial [Candidatus Sulfotelmatobacter sp.]